MKLPVLALLVIYGLLPLSASQAAEGRYALCVSSKSGQLLSIQPGPNGLDLQTMTFDLRSSSWQPKDQISGIRHSLEGVHHEYSDASGEIGTILDTNQMREPDGKLQLPPQSSGTFFGDPYDCFMGPEAGRSEIVSGKTILDRMREAIPTGYAEETPGGCSVELIPSADRLAVTAQLTHHRSSRSTQTLNLTLRDTDLVLSYSKVIMAPGGRSGWQASYLALLSPELHSDTPTVFRFSSDLPTGSGIVFELNQPTDAVDATARYTCNALTTTAPPKRTGYALECLQGDLAYRLTSDFTSIEVSERGSTIERIPVSYHYFDYFWNTDGKFLPRFYEAFLPRPEIYGLSSSECPANSTCRAPLSFRGLLTLFYGDPQNGYTSLDPRILAVDRRASAQEYALPECRLPTNTLPNP